MAYYIGFDCSSFAVHMAILDDSGNILYLEKFADTTKDLDERCNKILDIFQQYVREHEEIFLSSKCVIENAVYIQNVKTAFAIHAVVSGVKRELHDKAGLYCLGVDVKHWKSVVLGDSKADKDKIKNFAELRWGKGRFKEQDFADASCIAFYGVLRLK